MKRLFSPSFIADLCKEDKSIYIEIETIEGVIKTDFFHLFQLRKSVSEKLGVPLQLIHKPNSYIHKDYLLTLGDLTVINLTKLIDNNIYTA